MGTSNITSKPNSFEENDDENDSDEEAIRLGTTTVVNDEETGTKVKEKTSIKDRTMRQTSSRSFRHQSMRKRRETKSTRSSRSLTKRLSTRKVSKRMSALDSSDDEGSVNNNASSAVDAAFTTCAVLDGTFVDLVNDDIGLDAIEANNDIDSDTEIELRPRSSESKNPPLSRDKTRDSLFDIPLSDADDSDDDNEILVRGVRKLSINPRKQSLGNSLSIGSTPRSQSFINRFEVSDSELEQDDIDNDDDNVEFEDVRDENHRNTWIAVSDSEAESDSDAIQVKNRSRRKGRRHRRDRK